MTKYGLSDPDMDASVVQARQAYRKVLARHGLLTFTSKEVAQARGAMEPKGNPWICPDDIRFQAFIMRLGERNLSPEAVDIAVKELIDAELDCDQARWERDCHRAAMMEHLHFRLPHHTSGAPSRAKPLAKPSPV